MLGKASLSNVAVIRNKIARTTFDTPQQYHVFCIETTPCAIATDKNYIVKYDLVDMAIK